MLDLLFYSLLGGLMSLVGGLLLIAKPNLTKKILTPLISFGAGAFLSAAFFDVLPESVEMVTEPHPVLASVLVGFLGFFILERFLMTRAHHSPNHEHSNHTESLPILLILGDCLHNLLDGILIALSYLANPVLGLSTAIAVAAHEIPQEIGDFSILLSLGWSRKKIIIVNIFQSLLTIPGVIIGFYAGQMFEPILPYLLAATSGVFIYIAASDLIPELHHISGHKHFARTVLPMIMSVTLLYYVIAFVHQ